MIQNQPDTERSVNKLMAMTLDMISGSSYQWHWKRVIFHHTYVNTTGHDTDIALGAMVHGLVIGAP